jgi:UDP-N-acetylglucosamine 4-epimerase
VSRYLELCEELAARPRRWLVTGAAGFIGSALMERLLELGQEVVGLDNFATGHRANLDDVLRAVGPDRARRFTFLEGDIRDPESCRRACQGIDHVLHQAALGSVPRSVADPIGTHLANVDGFLHMMLAARDAQVVRAVYASSSSVYGDHPRLPKVEDQIGRQLSPYAVTKRVDELYAGVIQDSYRVELVGLRYFNVYGRRQDPNGPYAAVIPRWIGRLLAGQRCQIFGDGKNSRDFCYVDDVVQANLLAACTGDAAVTNQVYNVGANGRTDLIQLYEMIRDGLVPFRAEVASETPEHTAAMPGDVRHSQADIGKLVAAFGFESTHEIRAGLRKTVAWFAERALAR